MDATENKPDKPAKTAKLKKVLIMAGGTGGHVMPALAVAEYLKEQGAAIHWLGTQSGIEARLVPLAQIPISYIEIQAIRRTTWHNKLLAPWRILKALLQSIRILQQQKPDVVLSMGGYVSGPGALAAWLLKYPLILHEQNAVAGWTNEILAKFARKVLVAFPQVFANHANKVVWAGNPVRKTLLSLPQPEARYQAKQTLSSPLNILILGGSQGARSLNELIPQALALIPKNKRPHIWHQTGKNHLTATSALYAQQQISANLSEFIEDMAQAYEWADLIICRAGALTVAEIAAVGVASILVPFPYAVDDHQTLNAKYLSDQQAAILMPQSQLNAQKLSQIILDFIDQPARCLAMAQACHSLAKPLATRMVAEQCLEVSSGA